MRVYLEFPDALLGILQDRAREAHRPPRYHLEWIIEQALLESSAPKQTIAHAQEVADAQQG
jgi:hypothetical protein